MADSYKKLNRVQLSQHFSTLDMDCKCRRPECKTTLVDPVLIIALEHLWKESGPFQIDSGFRCQAHNKDVGGVSNSFHLKGMAADIKSEQGYNGSAMSSYADRVPEIKGIGKAWAWIHVDTREIPSRWIYPIIF